MILFNPLFYSDNFNRKAMQRSLFLFILYSVAIITSGQNADHKSGITVVSYLLRDRAVVIDSLVLRKCMYVEFKTGHSISEVKGSAAIGTLSYNGGALARDTAWLFDEAAGNLGFNLPYVIPEGAYRLEIQIVNSKGKILDSLSEEYDRSDLKPYFNREIQFWDFTTPYAHLECSGYGNITYHFNSNKLLTDLKEIEISARMNSDNDLPGIAEAVLNGYSLGKFAVPAGDAEKSVVRWQIQNPDILKSMTLQKGENQLRFIIRPEKGYSGMGLRIYSYKNSSDEKIDRELPITLSVKSGMSLQKDEFRIPVWGLEGEHITSKFKIPAPDKFMQAENIKDESSLEINPEDVNQGYVVFTRNFQRYVYPWTIPSDTERINILNVRMSRNDFEPVTFGIYPIRDLGNVKVSVSDLTGPSGKTIPSENVLIQVAKIMKIRTGEGNRYQLVPRLLERSDNTEIPISYTTRFWLTVHTDSLTLKGNYNGSVQISTEKEGAKTIPFTIEVMPVTL